MKYVILIDIKIFSEPSCHVNGVRGTLEKLTRIRTEMLDDKGGHLE